MPQDLNDDCWLVNVGSGNGLTQHAITWASVDPDVCRYTTALGHNVFRGSNVTY